MDSPADTAYHEAGHAVALYENLVRFRRINIERDGDSLGRVTVVNPKWYIEAIADSSTLSYTSAEFRRARLHMENRVIGYLAGHLAQERRAGRSPGFEACESDLEQSVQEISRFVGSERTADAYLRLLWEMARDLVEMESTWRAIEALAAALLERKTIGYRDASNLIREAKWK